MSGLKVCVCVRFLWHGKFMWLALSVTDWKNILILSFVNNFRRHMLKSFKLYKIFWLTTYFSKEGRDNDSGKKRKSAISGMNVFPKPQSKKDSTLWCFFLCMLYFFIILSLTKMSKLNLQNCKVQQSPWVSQGLYINLHFTYQLIRSVQL